MLVLVLVVWSQLVLVLVVWPQLVLVLVDFDLHMCFGSHCYSLTATMFVFGWKWLECIVNLHTCSL